MPLYEFQCSECGKKTEVLQRFADAPLAVCPACGGPVRKLVSSPSFQFKGSGWYVTDYARKAGGGEGKGEGASGESESSVSPAGDGAKPAEPKSESAPAGKSESASATKTESKTESKPAGKSAAKPASGGSGSGS
jgi:putative FmdB family regulatory protein